MCVKSVVEKEWQPYMWGEAVSVRRKVVITLLHGRIILGQVQEKGVGI